MTAHTKTKFGWGFGLLLTLSVQTAQTAVNIANTPLILPSPLTPNVILTLDDSGSMQYGVLTRSQTGTIPFDTQGTDGDFGERFYKSAHFNPYYYNPNIRYTPPPDANGQPLSTSFDKAWINGFDQSRGWVDLRSEYRPVLLYNPSVQNDANNRCNTGQTFMEHFEESPPTSNNGPYKAADGFNSASECVRAYYYVFNPQNANCNGAVDDEDCYTKVEVSAAEEQNFANWYSFYRTRNLLTVSAAARAFTGLNGRIRLGWQAINSCTSFSTNSCAGWNNATVDNQLRDFSGTHKTNFYAWLGRLPAFGPTPLRSAMQRAGEYFKQDRLYRDNPDAAISAMQACRDNFHVLMTDGEWTNESFNAVGNADGTNGTLPDGTVYTPRAPYQDANSNTLADIAFEYWSEDLRPDLANNVMRYIGDRNDPSYWNPRNNPATWQHMVNFTVGLGLTVRLNDPAVPWTGEAHQGAGYTNLLSGTSWPDVYHVNSTTQLAARVYDLWHAALNSRGKFYSTDDPNTIQAAFDDVVARIYERIGAAAAIAANSTRLNTDTLTYLASFDGQDWHGRLVAHAVTASGLGPLKWEASIPATRHLYTWSGSAPAVFAWSQLTTAQQAAIGSQDIFNYLIGDTSREARNGGSFRNRSSLLGDIVNSDPLFVGAQDFGYSRLAEGADTSANPYKTFLAYKRNRMPMLYVGANDGMLHAFRADADQPDSGQEKFAYIPNAVIPHLRFLSEPNYTHRFYVDGPAFAGDAFFGTPPRWRTILIGTTGAGGRAVFALDVTDPSTFATSNPVLWEFTHPELGYTIGQAVIARLNNGRWAAVFGNGYNSDSDRAGLFIVYLDPDLSDGWTADVDYRYIPLGTQTDNGLASPALYDRNRDMVTDTIYAGDMQGNLWKIDVSSPNPANWGIAITDSNNNKVPLFTARNAANQVQPITAALDLGAPPPGKRGVMVYFGTGRFMATADKTDTTVQSLYGILDDGTAANRSQLQQQTIVSVTTIGGRNTRQVSQNPVDYNTQRGWYLDLDTLPKERVVSAPQLRFNRVFFTTLVPSDDACVPGGTSWVMELSALSGGQTNVSIFDLTPNNDVLAGLESTVGIIRRILFLGQGSQASSNYPNTGSIPPPPPPPPECWALTYGSNTYTQVNKTLCDVTTVGRVSWREIID